MPATAPATTPAAPRLTDEQVSEVLRLLKGSDSAELKLTVPELAQRSTIMSLGLDPLDAQIRQVFFFDTPDLALDRQGVVVRARRVQGKGDDSVIKLRPIDPTTLPKDLRRSSSFNVEVDALPGGYVCSATMKGVPKPGSVWKTIRGEKPIHKLYSKEQRAFYDAHVDGVALDDLSILGPFFVLKLRYTPKQLGRRLVAEAWLYPDGSRILELSTRCGTAEAFNVGLELRAFLQEKQVDLSGEQETKTRKALRFFAAGA